MRILHIGKFYPPHAGGMEVYLQQLIQRQSQGMQVAAVVANDYPRTQVESTDGATIIRVASHGSIASMPLTPSMAWHIHHRSADLIHLHMPNPGAAFSLLMARHSGRLVITHHADTLGRPRLKKLVSPFVRRIMERADSIIATSHGYLDSSEELAPYRSKCAVIPSVVRDEFFASHDSSASAEIRNRYGDRLVIAVGRLVPYKGFEYLIRAMREVRGRLLLIGTGPLNDNLKTCIRQCGVENKVRMLGKISDAEITSFYHAASLLVMPSVTRAEAFGLVQAEAMACGLPVVNTSIPSGVPDVSVHLQTGLTVAPENPDALAHAINKLLDDDALRTRFGAAAREAARNNYSLPVVAGQINDLYQRVLQASN